jgi:hypothetical protein
MNSFRGNSPTLPNSLPFYRLSEAEISLVAYLVGRLVSFRTCAQVKVFGCRPAGRIGVLGGLASESLRGTKPAIPREYHMLLLAIDSIDLGGSGTLPQALEPGVPVAPLGEASKPPIAPEPNADEGKRDQDARRAGPLHVGSEDEDQGRNEQLPTGHSE